LVKFAQEQENMTAKGGLAQSRQARKEQPSFLLIPDLIQNTGTK